MDMLWIGKDYQDVSHVRDQWISTFPGYSLHHSLHSCGRNMVATFVAIYMQLLGINTSTVELTTVYNS